jgi:hypothetical protein
MYAFTYNPLILRHVSFFFKLSSESLISKQAYMYKGRFVMFSVITNIYNKKTKGPILMESFTATGKLKKVFFDNYRFSMCAPRVTQHASCF